METVLEVRDLRKTYKMGKINVEALRGVNLSVTKGEFVAIMGPSGCGKSTLLHIVGAMVKSTSGNVFIEGKDISGFGDAERTRVRRESVGFVFQKLNLLPALSVRANVDVARYIRGGRFDSDAARRLDEIFNILMLRDKMDHKPAELSGGEQQRVAIARALVDSPAIVLADEPTGNLDTENSEIILDMFQRLNQIHNQTILMVTHNPEMADGATRLVRMRDGRIVADTANPVTEDLCTSIPARM
jgi:putative ABC transport system ATP-binding protein